LQGYIFILVLLALMWFLLIRPQRRRQLEQQRMIDALRIGKEIVTAGGLYGTVTEVAGDEVRLEIADGIEVRVAKRAIAGIVNEEEEEELEEAEEAEEAEDAADETPANLSR
jgi:preprotein translocase subunit YajC